MSGTASATRHAGNLRVAVTSFVGRRREISEVRRLVSVSRLVTLTGVGGVGKTRLALEVAARSRGAFPDGVWVVDLATVEDGAEVAQAVADTIGIADQSARPPADKIAGHLLHRQVLIVLDNCEHLLDECAALADLVLRAAPDVRVLATSRRALATADEHLFTVPPLSVPDPERLPDAAVLGRYDAVGLLVERASAVLPGFTVTAANHRDVARLCARLDGIPLAIELAARRLRSLSVGELAGRLEDRFALLTGGDRVALPRQQTLRALIDWSHGLCSERERLLWARLSVFSGGFDLPAAEGVCAGDGLAAGEIVDLLGRLVDQSIVLGEDRDGGMRYRLLETVRQYGRERLAGSGAEAVLRGRHRDFYLARVRGVAGAWCGPGQEAALARLRADHGDLRAAFEFCAADPQGAGPALEMAAVLRHHWYAGGFLPEGRRWLDRALDLPDQPSGARATALWVAAWVCLLQGGHRVAADRLTECEALSVDLGDSTCLAYATSLRGTAALFEGDPQAAVEHFAEAIAELQETGDVHGALMAMFQMAISLAHLGDTDRAAAVCERALAISAERGERLVRSYILWVLGFTTWRRGDPVGATAHTREALAIQRGFNDHVGAGLMIELLAWLASARGQDARAARLLGAARCVWAGAGTTISAIGPHLAAHHDSCEQRTKRVLPDVEHHAARAGLEELTVAEAITRALDEQAPRTGGAARAATSSAPAVSPGPDAADGLTPREREVAGLVAQGMSNRAIAQALVISPRTVDGHVEHILDKLGFTGRAQIAAWVAERRAGTTGTTGHP
ncbi:ATP-binding protein [Spirillospora sp. CA-128828]|uniref:ATP-binding protein n=1 Tax=Spirillospora sp. CA-128828 TaxID=3240033 RepID=UPI003D8B0841